MDKDEIIKIRDHYQKVADRNYQNYQETGYRKYERAYERAEDIVEICDRALLSADDHTKYIEMRATMVNMISEAILAFEHEDGARALNVCKNLKAYNGIVNIATDPYK